jgi:ornithine--oxo-acid transaminase
MPNFLETIFSQLQRSADRVVLREVRGKGLWIGIELTVAARPYCEALMREGILCKETHDTVIRIAPPLIISRDEVDWACERIKKVIEKN